MPGLRHDLDDVAVLQVRPQRHHRAVDAGADALMADVGVNRVGEVDRSGAARQRLHLAPGREAVDLLRVEVDLQVLDELLRIADLLLPLDQLPQPAEVLLVRLGADPAFLVLPVRRDAFLGDPVHVDGPDLDLERQAAVADDRRVQRLVAVRPRHRDEVLDPARNRLPRLVDDAERGVGVLHRIGDDADRDQVVDLLELDLLPFELEEDAVEALDAAVDLAHRHLGLGQLLRDRPLQLLDHALGDAPLVLDLGLERLVGDRLEGAERGLLELVLHLAHPQPVGDRGVDVERLLGDAPLALVRQVVDRPHVVLAIGELDEDDADVVHHRQQHLAEVLGLAGLARGERDGPDLGHPLDDVGDLGPEQLLDAADGGEGVLDDVVEQAGGNGDDVQPHVGQQTGHFQGVHQVGLAGVADLALVLEGREDVRPPQQLDVGVRGIGADLVDEILEPNHRGGV